MKKLNKNIALLQVLILVFGIVAIGYAIGSSVETISAAECSTSSGTCGSTVPFNCGDTINTQGGECIDKAGESWSSEETCHLLDGTPGKITCCHCKLDPFSACCVPDIQSEETIVPETEAPLLTDVNYENPDTFEQNWLAQFYDENGTEQNIDIPDGVDKNNNGKIDEDEKAGIMDYVSRISTVGGAIEGGAKVIKLFKAGEQITEITTSGTGKAVVKQTDKLPWKHAVRGVLQTAGIALIAAELYYFAFRIAGASDRNLKDLQNAAILTTIGTTAVLTIGANLIGFTAAGTSVAGFGTGAMGAFWTEAGTTIAGGTITGPGVLVIAAVVIVAMTTYVLTSYKEYYKETFTYIPGAWKAEDGGKDCDKCNNLKYGCSEYQCKTFGKACGLVNPGTEYEACIWNNTNDAQPPIITPIENILPNDYTYNPIQISSPPATGVELIYSGINADSKGCIPPYTSVMMVVETNELAECKVDIERTPDYESMLSPLAEGLILTKNHTLYIPHAASASTQSLEVAGISEIQNGEDQQFFIRCKDANGNIGELEFLMEFCVQDGPDTQAPLILGTNFLETSYLQFNQTSSHLEVYTNEPADCKWDFDDLDYNDLQFEMTDCSFDVTDFLNPSTFQYGCIGTIAGLKDYVDNTIYIKCNDKPWWTEEMTGRRYENKNPYKLTLIGTQPLIIKSITIDGKESGAIIKDNTNIIRPNLEVIVSAGAENGKARCSYSIGGIENTFYNGGIPGFVQNNIQKLSLTEGYYNVSIKCEDAGGNTDIGWIEFTLDEDGNAPNVVRAYKDAGYLRIITDEPAECVYNTKSNVGCDYLFEDGTEMTGINGDVSHYTTWEENEKYYIKCKDEFGNRPALQNECSIIIQAYEDFQ